jgi:hypothetical protein
MTVGMFDSYLERMHLHRAERMMDMGQATIYAQVTTESRRQMWNGWSNIVSSINTRMIQRDAEASGDQPLTWNGQVISIKGLVRKFAQTFGKKAVVG